MNQNILVGLERQAEKLVLQIPAALDSNEYTSLFNEKFAELIVRECMDIAREVGTSTEPEDFALDRCYEIETKIKEYFGVEE